MYKAADGENVGKQTTLANAIIEFFAPNAVTSNLCTVHGS
jgi:hypothetical protein